MATPNAPISMDLQEFLYNRATLYSGNDAIRLSLVQRTLRAAAAEIDLNPDLSIEEGLFEIMQSIALQESEIRIRELPAVKNRSQQLGGRSYEVGRPPEIIRAV